MLKLFLKYIALFLLLPTFIMSHAVYVSLCDIKADSLENQYTATIAFFTDDLQYALLNNGHTGDSLTTDNPALLTLGRDYVLRNLQLEIDGTAVELDYQAQKSRAGTARVFLVFSFHHRKAIHNISATHRSLFEIYEQQKNMIRVTLGGQRLNLLLSSETPSGIIELN